MVLRDTSPCPYLKLTLETRYRTWVLCSLYFISLYLPLFYHIIADAISQHHQTSAKYNSPMQRSLLVRVLRQLAVSEPPALRPHAPPLLAGSGIATSLSGAEDASCAAATTWDATFSRVASAGWLARIWARYCGGS